MSRIHWPLACYPCNSPLYIRAALLHILVQRSSIFVISRTNYPQISWLSTENWSVTCNSPPYWRAPQKQPRNGPPYLQLTMSCTVILKRLNFERKFVLCNGPLYFRATLLHISGALSTARLRQASVGRSDRSFKLCNTPPYSGLSQRNQSCSGPSY